MRIVQITVEGLFGRFHHDLAFPGDEKIAIMIGPNGVGKTMILRIINTLFNRSLHALDKVPFESVTVRLDDGSRLQVDREPETTRETPGRHNVQLEYTSAAGVTDRVSPTGVDPLRTKFPLEMVDEWVPFLERTGATQWRDIRNGEALDFDEVVARFSDQFPGRHELFPVPDWLRLIREAMPVRLIDTERLTAIDPDRARVNRAARISVAPSRAVRRYSHDLANRIQRTFTEYGSLSQSLDRTFPSRLVAEAPKPELGMDRLREELVEIDAKRGRLVQAGLLKDDSVSWNVTPALNSVDESKLGVLAVYARDAKEKLGVFDDLYARVDAFRRIANSRLLYKRITVGAEGLCVTSTDGTTLDVEMLSSGEQHELVLLYTLLFRVPRNSFLLIDEPELSLHVAWQETFLADLEQMATLSEFRVLLATHSPQIIGDRWDLTVELRGPNDK